MVFADRLVKTFLKKENSFSLMNTQKAYKVVDSFFLKKRMFRVVLNRFGCFPENFI